MKSNYDVLRNHIRLIDTRNKDNVTEKVLGINIDKFFMHSVANVIGTDLSKYKLITKGKFACNPMLEESERLYWELSDDEECNLEDFKSYFKNVWEYFSRYIGFFDIDREDVKIVSYLNRIDTLLHCEKISCLEV